jgi:hypothetical protein
MGNERGFNMQVDIREWEPGLVSGLEVFMVNEVTPTGDYFAWRPSGLAAEFADSKISGGMVEACCKNPEYTKVEYHSDYEVFYFTSGDGVMLFCSLEDGKPLLETCVMLHVKEGMQLCVAPGKAHFVPISLEKDAPVKAVVVSPEMDTWMVELGETVSAK